MARLAGAVTPERRRQGAWAFLVAVVAFGFWIDHDQDLARCRARNESTAESVGIVVDAMVDANPDADPGRVRAFRDDIDRRLVAARVDCT